MIIVSLSQLLQFLVLLWLFWWRLFYFIINSSYYMRYVVSLRRFIIQHAPYPLSNRLEWLINLQEVLIYIKHGIQSGWWLSCILCDGVVHFQHLSHWPVHPIIYSCTNCRAADVWGIYSSSPLQWRCPHYFYLIWCVWWKQIHAVKYKNKRQEKVHES